MAHFLVLTKRLAPMADAVLMAHRAYLADLKQKDIAQFYGGFKDASGGAILYEASTEAEAQELVTNDPLYKAGTSEFVIKEWMI